MLQWIDAINTSNATPRQLKPHRFDRFIICKDGGRWHHLVPEEEEVRHDAWLVSADDQRREETQAPQQEPELTGSLNIFKKRQLLYSRSTNIIIKN